VTRRDAAPLLLLVGIAGCATASKTDEGSSTPIHGSLSSRYQGRWTSGEQDHDLYEVLTTQVGDAKKDAVTGFFMGEAAVDLDGRSDQGAQSPFYSLEDTYSGSVSGHVYHAYADFHRAGELETLRVGRQMIIDTPEAAYIDGVRAETRELGDGKAKLGAYGGIPVQLYDSSVWGDSMFGLFGDSRPWSGGRVRADWMHVEQEELLGRNRNDLFGLGAWQNFGKEVRVEGNWTRLEEKNRDLRFRATWNDADADLVVQGSWYRLLETQLDQTVPFDPYYNTLYALYPYEQYGALVSKGISEHVDVQAGFDLRRVEESQDLGQFNHDYDRGFLTAGFTDVFAAGLDLSVTGDVWDADGEDINSFGAELSRRFGEKVQGSLGTDYSLYKYDLYQDRELDHVRTWYAGVRWKRAANATFDARYEFEDDETDQFHSLRLGMTWGF
jgi:hypothetical protein